MKRGDWPFGKARPGGPWPPLGDEVQVDRDDWIEAGQTLYKEPETCEWHRKTDTGGDPYGPWITSCGNEWDLQGPEGIGPFEYPDEYGFEFCPFTGCGRKIEVKGE